ncbi:hypothetical protein [Winogradskyella vidalii]|uniref:hypothetical protein n=1 Tax=Winogradskyella vidalii TaxID=2615024 RepID=UPI0015C9ADBF|nr:hypothetical protein [Winogradskyella vidalii]
MIKIICTLLVLLSAINTYGQDIFLLKNTNPKAKELLHRLNSTKDSLILESKTKIIQVDIFNEDYDKIITVDGYNAQISLGDIPEGKLVIEAKLADKVIVMGLLRLTRDNGVANTATASQNIEVIEGNGMMLDESLNVIKRKPHNSIAFLLTGAKSKTESSDSEKLKFFWVVIKVNNEIGSSKTMRLVNEKTVERMILKHKQELNSASGKLNELTVWEVYNTSKFMERQVLNPDFFYSLSSDLFNTTPYYSTHNNVANL